MFMKNANDFSIAEDVELAGIQFDLLASELGKQHGVADIDCGGDLGALVVVDAGTDGDDLANIGETLLAAEDDAGLGLGDGLDLLDEDAVEEGDELLELDGHGL